MDKERIKTQFLEGWAQLSPIFQTVIQWMKRLVWVFPPLIVLVAMLVLFKTNGLYPFTSKTIAWCDMDQQVIPLLLQFKDILAGKENFFFSLKNAGGMNFYGVFFFFLASPFSFLVAFVDKADMASFCNILVMLKMCVCALTASLYFFKKNPNAPILNVALSVLYAYSGYTMMYYQNVMWLDVAYLFPLLLWGLERLQKGKRALFIVALSASMIVNYYLGYMLVVFLLLYAFVWMVIAKDKQFAVNFIICCFVSALITAVVWLPSFWQYLSSGRGTSILLNLRDSSVLTHFQTALPTVFSVLFLFPFALTKKEGADCRLRWVLFLATLAPLVFEPINKMWQTGSYMSFPTRYAFITIFLCLSLAFDNMTRKEEEQDSFKDKILRNWRKEAPMYALSLCLCGISIGYYAFSKAYTDKNVTLMDQYSQGLWGSTESLEALLGLYVIALIVGAVFYLLWRFRLFKPVLLWLSIGVLVLSELYVAPMTYMLTPAHEVDWYQQVVELADKLPDDEFYRVKTDREYSGRDFDVTLMGGLGYNALGHYTSLTDGDYMTAIKQFGYTSYWMEVGNSGGTLLTDALLSVKYQISSAPSSTEVYEGTYFNISEKDSVLPLGILAKTDIIALEQERSYASRAALQNTLYTDFFGVDGVTMYEMNEAEPYRLTVEEKDGKYLLTPTGSGASLTFKIPVDEATLLYANIFDENTNDLNQAINGKFSVQTARYSMNSYPSQKNNGLLEMGEYAGQTVTVKIGVKETVLVKEVGIVAMQKEKLQEEIANADTVGLTVKNGKIGGRYEANGGESVFLSIPYNAGLRLKINGKRAELCEVYGGFTAFYLEEGVNEIEITFLPKGFGIGLTITIFGLSVGLAGVAMWIWKKWSLKTPEGWIEDAAYYGVLAVGALVVFVIYIAPMLLCAL